MIGGILKFYFILRQQYDVCSKWKIAFCFERWHIFSSITETSPFKSNPKFAPNI